MIRSTYKKPSRCEIEMRRLFALTRLEFKKMLAEGVRDLKTEITFHVDEVVERAKESLLEAVRTSRADFEPENGFGLPEILIGDVPVVGSVPPGSLNPSLWHSFLIFRVIHSEMFRWSNHRSSS